MLNTSQIKQELECPYCETGKAKLTIAKEHVHKNGTKYDWIIYRCDNCNKGKEGFTTTESDTVCVANIKGVYLVQPEGFEGITPLPWHLMETGFTKGGPGDPTIYATNEDLEMISKVSRDPFLCHSIQDNHANARYIVEACNQYPILKQEIQRLKDIIKNFMEEDHREYGE